MAAPPGAGGSATGLCAIGGGAGVAAAGAVGTAYVGRGVVTGITTFGVAGEDGIDDAGGTSTGFCGTGAAGFAA